METLFLFFLPLLLLGAAFVEPFLFDDDEQFPGESGQLGVTKRPEYQTEYEGSWDLIAENSGVSAMHLVITHKNKAIMFDSSVFGPSQIPLPKTGTCRKVPGSKTNEQDCWAHAVEFDLATSELRPLKVLTDTWCSSGGFAADGTLVQTGGWNDGGKAVRYLAACDTCDWKEYPTALSGQRWYSTQQILPDGSFVVVGGRRMFNYEYVPAAGKSNPINFNLPLLRETTDEVENNLYPFVHLSPDGNLFIFANNRAILIDPKKATVLREFPPLKGGSRNYPSSGMSVLLPINLRSHGPGGIYPAEVIVCGGSPSESPILAAKGTFLPALRSCGRISITNPDSTWHIEQMPTARTVGDMLLLPNAEVLLINGASKGAAGWDFARDPVLEPVLYRPNLARADRFRTLAKTDIPRMYHSSSAVLPDTTVLVAGSNTNSAYNFTGVLFPTELRVEKFLPPYLDPMLTFSRLRILEESAPKVVKYGQSFSVEVVVASLLMDGESVKVTMYSPPFTTHGFSMNQRLLILRKDAFSPSGLGRYKITVAAPPSGKVAPPGYYMLFVVNSGVPSKAVWILIQ